MIRTIILLLLSYGITRNTKAQNIYYSDFYTGFSNYNLDNKYENHLFNTDDFFGHNLKIDTINNVVVMTRGDEFLLYNLDGTNVKNITAVYSFAYNNYVLSPLEKAIYYTSENQLFRLTYEGQRDTIIKKVTNVTLNELCIDVIGRKLYFNKFSNNIDALIQCDLNGSNQKTIYTYKEDMDLYRMQLDAKNNRLFYRYWDDGAKLGVLNLTNRFFTEVLRGSYGSLLEYFYDDQNDKLYFVNSRDKNIEVKDLKSGQVSLVKSTIGSEVSNLLTYQHQLIWMDNRNNNNREFYIGKLDDVEQKELFYKDKTVPIRFDYNAHTQKLIGRTNWNQVVSTDLNGDNFKLHTDRGLYWIREMMYHKDKLYYVEDEYHFIASSNKDGSDYKIIHQINGSYVIAALIDDRTDYIYYANNWNQAIERVKIDGSGHEIFWLSEERDPILADITLDKNHNQLIVSEKNCKCVFTIDMESKAVKTLRSGNITTFYPDEIVYNTANDYIYINDAWNKKIYRMKSDGTAFSFLKNNVSGAIIKYYDEIENKMYGVFGENASFYEFDENATKTLAITSNFASRISFAFTKIPGQNTFFFIDFDGRNTNLVHSIDKNTKEIKSLLSCYGNPYSDYNLYAIDERNNIYYEYADYSGLLIETNLNNDSTNYYNDWPTFMYGFDYIDETKEFISYTDYEILKFSKEGQIIDTLMQKPHQNFASKHFFGVTYHDKEKRIYYLDYKAKQIQSVNTAGEDLQIHHTFPVFISLSRKLSFDSVGNIYYMAYDIDKNFLVRINQNHTTDSIYIPSLKLNGNYLILDSLPAIDADGDGLTFDEDCNDEQVLTTEIPNNGIDEDCDGTDLIIDNDGDGINSDLDCNDEDVTMNTFNTEIPYNNIDDDCNASSPDDDIDGDGFLMAEDCNDSNAQINPNAIEMPYNGEDDDCNASTVDNDIDGDGYNYPIDCNDNNSQVNPSAQEIPYNGLNDDCRFNTPDDDLDGDGFLLTNDCNDTTAAINPLADEIPDNEIDDNCNGEIDETTSTYDAAADLIFVYPNPADQFIFIRTQLLVDKIEMYNSTGTYLYVIEHKKVDVSNLHAGLYMLIFYMADGKTIVKKVIVL